MATYVYGSEPPTYELSLSQALQKARHKSDLLKSARASSAAAQERADATYTTLLPRLTLDGNLKYVSEVPSISVAPNAPSVPFGSHLNYSIGPTLSYTLWDGGGFRDNYKSNSKMLDSRKEDERSKNSQVDASVKLAYVHAQLGLEQVRVYADSVKLSQKQAKDIRIRKEQGSASELDMLSAVKDLRTYELGYKQKQAELAATLYDLTALVEENLRLNLTEPAPQGFENAGLWLVLDPLDQTVKTESLTEPELMNEAPPQIKSQLLLSESLDLQAKAQKAAYHPRIDVSARTSLDYPDGPVLKRINQNTLSVNLTMPLYEFSKVDHLVAQKNFEAESAKYLAQQMESDARRDFSKAKENLRSLRKQDLDAQELVKQSEKLAQLNYDAYRYGRLKFTDVQAANLRLQEAKLNLAQIHAQILMQVIVLQTLVVKEA